jgi:hypothetical protein
MANASFIAGALGLAFVVWIVTRGRTGAYLAVIGL